MPVEELTPYQAQVVALLESGVGIVTLGLALLVFLVSVAVVRHL